MADVERNEEMAMWEARFYSMAADFYMLFMTRPQLISDEDRRIFGGKDGSVEEVAGQLAYHIAMRFVTGMIHERGTVTETLRHHIDKREKEAGR